METLKFEEFGKGEHRAFPGVESEYPYAADGKIDGNDATWIMDGTTLCVIWEGEKRTQLTGKVEPFTSQYNFPHKLVTDAMWLFASAISNDISMERLVNLGFECIL